MASKSQKCTMVDARRGKKKKDKTLAETKLSKVPVANRVQRATGRSDSETVSQRMRLKAMFLVGGGNWLIGWWRMF